MDQYVYLNQELVKSETAHISIHDSGLLHGIGLFETMRSYNARVFLLPDHLDRLYRSAALLNITITHTPEQITQAIDDLLQANYLKNARLRLTITPGNPQLSDPESTPENTLIITAIEMTPYPAELYQQGMTTIISQYKQSPFDPLAGHKTTNYFARLLALREAQKKQCGEALWFTIYNRLAEGSISNIFLVKDQTLFTPPVNTPILPGITRKLILELAKELKIPCKQQELVIQDILQADEIFLTNSIMELIPVQSVEAHKLTTPPPGPIFQKLHQAYQQQTQSNLSFP